jgi:hypothetical protein
MMVVTGARQLASFVHSITSRFARFGNHDEDLALLKMAPGDKNPEANQSSAATWQEYQRNSRRASAKLHFTTSWEAGHHWFGSPGQVFEQYVGIDRALFLTASSEKAASP